MHTVGQRDADRVVPRLRARRVFISPLKLDLVDDKGWAVQVVEEVRLGRDWLRDEKPTAATVCRVADDEELVRQLLEPSNLEEDATGHRATGREVLLLLLLLDFLLLNCAARQFSHLGIGADPHAVFFHIGFVTP